MRAVGLRQIEMIEPKQAASDDNGGEKDRHSDAIETNTACLNGDDLAVFGKQGKTHERRHQHSQWRGGVDELRRQKEEVAADHAPRRVIADDVAKQVEKSNDLHHHQERSQEDGEVKDEAAQHIAVENLRKPRAEAAKAAGAALLANLNEVMFNRLQPCGESGGEVGAATNAVGAQDKKESHDEENDVAHPYAQTRRPAALA